jgi:hypothetical protein
MDPEIQYVLGLKAVRERAHRVLKLAEENRLNHFQHHPDRLQDAGQYVINIIKVCLPK